MKTFEVTAFSPSMKMERVLGIIKAASVLEARKAAVAKYLG